MSINEKMKAIADAIREKTGETAAMGLDKMAELIAAIETGGGLRGYASGEFTIAGDETVSGYSYIVTHGLGRVPTFWLLVQYTDVALSSSGTLRICYCSPKASYQVYYSGGECKISSYGNNRISVMSATETTIKAAYSSGYSGMPAGMTYIWFAK
jgi:hypothetical protein